MRRLVILSLSAFVLLAACGGSQSSPAPEPVPDPVPAPDPAPVLLLNPTTLSVQAAGAPTTLTATLLYSTEPVTWTLSPEVGALSASQGASVQYTPPASVTGLTWVTVTASAAGLSAKAGIEIEPESLLTVSPASATLVGGSAPVELSASLKNLSGTVLWSLGPSVGALSGTSGPSVLYTPPADVAAATTVTVFAIVGSEVSQAVLTVTPAPRLTVDPATAHVDTASQALPLTATLLNSTDPITWTLAPGSPGALSAQTGASVLYTPPTTLGLPAAVVVTASAAGLSAQARVTVEPAPSADNPPLLNKRFVPFSRVVEYLILGTSYDGTQNNQFAIDPFRAFGKVDDQPISFPPGVTRPDHDLLHRSLNSDMVGAHRKVARAGNLDDDFVDEAVVLTWQPGGAQPVAKLSILDASLAQDRLGADPTLSPVIPAGIDLTVEAGQAATDYDLALADVDGDGYDEVVVVGTVWPTNNTVHSGRLWVFDDLEHGCALRHQLELKGDYDSNHRGMLKARVAAGSMKNDRSVQIAVAWYDLAANTAAWNGWRADNLYSGIGAVSFALYDGATLTQIGANHRTGQLLGLRYAAHTNGSLFDVALADVDGDQKKELVFGGWNSAWWHTDSVPNSMVSVDVFDDLDAPVALQELGGGAQLHAAWDIDLSHGMLNSYPDDFLVPIDYNGDHVEEMLAGPFPWHVVKAANGNFGSASVAWDDGLMPVDKWTYHYSVADIQVGDVNGDLRQDFLVLYKGGQVKAWGLRDRLASVSGTPLQKNYAPNPDFVNLDVSGLSSTSSFDGNPYTAVLVPVNVDNDSTLLEYAGSAPSSSRRRAPMPSPDDPGQTLVAHRVVYGDNKLIALLAAPPVTDGLGQNNGSNATTFGTVAGGTWGAGAEFSTRAGVVVGAELEISQGFVVNVQTLRVELEISSQLEYTHSNSWSRSVSQQITDGASDGDDLVVFSATPYDRYTYFIASNPNPSLVGTTITVDVPQATQVMAVSRETYNATYSDGLLITRDLLQDTPYDLTSYPRRANVPTSTTSSLVDVGHGLKMASTVVPFGQMGPFNITEGLNFKSCELALSQDETWQDGVTFSLDVSAKVVTMGVLAGVSTGFSSGGYLERSTTNGIVFSSTVYGLPREQFTDRNKYSWGMYAYKQTLRDEQAKVAQDFFVVNYWTGAYGAQ